MDKLDIIKDISLRTKGEVYLGVVGPVRTGKSTFIKKFIENLVIPNMDDEYERRRCLDEIPQTAVGKTIMTIEPKFIPSSGANIMVDEIKTSIRLIDCVGYLVDGCRGYEDELGPRMVRTPWYDEEIPFIEAAEIGTSKVIKEHSTIGIVVTTDGTIGEIKRDSYKDAEERVINELKSIGKPFIVLLNSARPDSKETNDLASNLRDNYNVPVLPINILNMNENDSYNILRESLYEFPVSEINVNLPDYVAALKNKHWLKEHYLNKMKEYVIEVDKVRDIDNISDKFIKDDYISNCYISNIDSKTGIATINIESEDHLYNDLLKEIVGKEINTRGDMIGVLSELNEAQVAYNDIKYALNMVKETGYGVASPTLRDMKLETPEIIKQGSRYGIKLKAVAPSIHMIKVDVESTFEPIIGTEVQSKELIDRIMKDKDNVWKSEIFGQSLDVIVKEGIQAKLSLMPEQARFKLQQAIGKLVNKGSNNIYTLVI